ncbi:MULTISPECIES: S41 family peptidase [Paenibacillus]|uniref:Peptidase S41 n=1 Tax=Paenibacillus naphthalenovorans TaxID=162209 RepID=A0A0U2VG91_9BACL|nr:MULTISPECIES: S41 family peptidase [Paenibacillus]ALS22515.1 peptidase S41 [Paenibacillus naphthalenovorans]GCL70306.1 carboxyl-terminal protease [Paenibacillus naphthalenovorans]SDH86288.1 carboxyl-terminal processing protease [Paenibacillus naphthalenovorans]
MKRTMKNLLLRKAIPAVLSLSLLFPAAAPAWAAGAGSVTEVLELLEQNHVSSPNGSKLSDAAIQAMIDALNDPYTVYFTPEELKSFEASVENQYVGIGVRVTMEEDGLYITEVFGSSPASQAGLKAGDLIVRVEGESAIGKTLEEVTSRIIGLPGTKVNLQITRDGEPKDLTIERQKVQVPSVTAGRFQPGIGYLKVIGFSSDADEKMSQELAALKEQGIQSLIVDLRDNPGGILETAQQMARLFVKEGTLMHTKDRDNVDDPVKITNGTTQPFPVYFLVNENSASASEVLTGALQDYGAIKVIGTKTYGKGSVQQVVPLKSGGALKLTIQEYLTPKFRKVNGVGIEPDIKVEGGDVPQLLTALRLAGANRIDLSLMRLNLTVNGLAVNNTFRVIREQGQTYVPSRVLAALIGGTVEWNEANRTVRIGSADGQFEFGSAGGELLLKDGTGFVSLRQAASVWSALKWSDDGRNITIGFEQVKKPTA